MVCGCSGLRGAELDLQQRESPRALSLPIAQPKPKILFVQRLQLHSAFYPRYALSGCHSHSSLPKW